MPVTSLARIDDHRLVNLGPMPAVHLEMRSLDDQHAANLVPGRKSVVSGLATV